MSLSTTITKNVYVGDAATVIFPYNFRIFQDSDLEVKEILIADPFTEVSLTLDTDYTVSGAGDATGGVVTLTTATASTKNLVIMRVLTIVQSLDLEQNGDNPSQSLEDQFDKSAMIGQQLQEQLDRAVLTGADDSGNVTSIDLASPGPIGGTTPAAGTFTVVTCSSMTLNGKLTAGANEIEGSAFDINGGNADNLVIGSGTATTGKFTVLTTISTAVLSSVGITGTLTLNDLSNAVCQLVDNDGTNYGINIQQDGILASTKNALFVYSGVAQTIAPLILFEQDNASTTQPVLTIDNKGGGSGIFASQTGILGAGKHVLLVQSNVNHTTADTALVLFNQDAVGASEPVIEIKNDGSGVQIQGDGNENLSVLGVWTDRTSLLADKENITPLVTSELVEKLKGMKLHRYQKKDEVYGKKVDNLYPKDIKQANAKEYVGLILDDPTTPEELISRDLDGNINGKSGTQIAEYLLGVCQEIIIINEALEDRIEALEM